MTSVLIFIGAWCVISVPSALLLGPAMRDAVARTSFPIPLGGTRAHSAAEGRARPVAAPESPRSVLPGASQPAKSAPTPSLPRRW